MNSYNTLAERYHRMISQYSMMDSDWVTFVKDHRKLLLSTATKREINHEQARTYRYSPTLWIQDYGERMDTVWITLWLNNILTTDEFCQLEYLLIPDNDTIVKLYNQYASNKKQFDIK